MRLFLASVSIAEKNREAFLQLVGRQPVDINVALIENGADMYPVDGREWVERARRAIEGVAGSVEIIDLREYVSATALEADLSKFDVIWVGGGNTYYLRWIMRESGFDQIIRRLCNKGIVYGGDSAGAIVAGPTLECFQVMDNPEKAPEVIVEGLGLTNLVVVPHADHSKYGALAGEVKRKLDEAGYETALLNDDEALVIR